MLLLLLKLNLKFSLPNILNKLYSTTHRLLIFVGLTQLLRSVSGLTSSDSVVSISVTIWTDEVEVFTVSAVFCFT